MALLLLAAAAVAGLVIGDPVDGYIIVAIVVLNAVIGVVQEGKAADSLEALRSLETLSALVVREGIEGRIPARDLVRGDLVRVVAGDRIPADMRLVSATGLELDESLLTGESLPIAKTADALGEGADTADLTNMAYSGTHVTRGVGSGLVVSTGARTRMGAIASALDTEAPATPLQRELSTLTRRLGMAAVLVAASVFGLMAGVGGEGTLEAAFLVAVALAVAAVPEGLPTVVTLALALGVRRMAGRGAIVRRLSAVESLGAATVLLTDKTGTLTENLMRVDVMLSPSGDALGPDHPARERFGRAAHASTTARLDPPVGDPMDVALLAALVEEGLASPSATATTLARRPFDSTRRSVAAVSSDEDGIVLAVKGAPEELLSRCAELVDDRGRPRRLGEEDRRRIALLVDEWAERGARLLAVADRRLADAPTEVEAEEHDLVLLGLAVFRDPVREAAPAAVSDARRAGIDVIMVTGDHPGTARAVAQAVGIDAASVMTGRDLRSVGPPASLDVSVYARVEPEQKLDLVDAYQRRGDVVAVTGDGVNDGPALRRADIGVAMGRRGSDVAKEASALVIVDDDLSTIVAAVEEGRGIYDNLRKVVDYLVAGNLSEIFVVVAGLFLLGGTGTVLTPVQLLWLNLLTDGLPALALGVDTTAPGVLERKPRRSSERLLGRARLASLLGRAAVIASGPLVAYAVARWVLEADEAAARSVVFTTLVFAHVLYAFAVRPGTQPVPPKLFLAVGVAIALQVILLVVAPFGAMFDVVGVPVGLWLLIVGSALVPVGLLVLRRRSASAG